jgi:hypothetical protein
MCSEKGLIRQKGNKMRRIFTLAIVAVMLTTSIAIGDVTIAFMSDGRPQKVGGEALLTEDFDQLLAQMDTGWTLDAIQFVGDMDYLTNTVAALADSDVADVPVFHCIANHEVDNQYDLYAVRAAFENYHFNPTSGPAGTEETTYYYEVGDMLVVVINIYWDGDNDGAGDWYTPGGGLDEDDSTFKYSSTDGGYITDELYAWLEDVLSTSTKTYKLVVGHEPAYPVNRHIGDSLDQDETNRDKFWNLLKTKGVAAYMTAHDHSYHLDEHDGVFEADSGVCGGMLGGGGPGQNDNFATIIYAHIDDQTGNFEFKVVHEQPGAGNWNNPVVIREILAPPSPEASNPSPGNGVGDVDINADLSWTAGAGAVSHDVYFGEDSANLPRVSEGQSETTYDPGILANVVTYYWRIDEFDGSTTHTGTVWNFTTAPVPEPAVYVSPTNGAEDVAVDADLSWTAGSDATSHDVYFGTDNPPLFEQTQAGTTYDPGTLANEDTYYWRIDEVGPGGVTPGTAIWSFTTESVPDAVADSDIPVKGTVGGSYVDTQNSDGIDETITETKSGGKPSNRYSLLEHKWTINVIGGETVTFYVEAYKNSEATEDFVFAYSADDSSYTEMVTVTETYETVQSYVLPASTAGTVYIRVKDTDRTAGNMSFDTISIDHMYIKCAGAGEPDTEPPTAPTGLTTTPISATQIDLDWADNTEPDLSHYSVWRSTTAGGNPDPYTEIASDVVASNYSDTGLSASMTYYYVVRAVDTSSNESGNSNEASATTWQLSAPGQATDPTPTDGQTRVNNRSVILSWIAGTDAVSHDVYLGTSPTLTGGDFIRNQTDTTYDPPENLQKKTTYYWRIDEFNAAGTTLGVVWSFTTR